MKSTHHETKILAFEPVVDEQGGVWPAAAGRRPWAVYVPGLGSADGEIPKARSPKMSEALQVIQDVHRGTGRSSVIQRAEAALIAEDGYVDPDRAWLGLLALAYADCLGAAEKRLERLARDVRWSDSLRHEEVLTLARAHVALLRGAAAGARELLGPLVRHPSSRSVLLLAVAWLIEAQVALGATDRAQRLLVKHDLAGALDMDELDRPHVLAARGALHLAAGRFRQGIDDYRACGELLTSLDVANPAVIPWRSRAAVGALAVGRVDFAVALAEDELAAAYKWGSHRAVGCALHALALARQDADSPAQLKEADELLGAAQAGIEQVRVLHDLSVLQASQHELAAAQNSIDTAIALSRRYRNRFWVRRLEVVHTQLTAPDKGIRLTKQELKVARLARAGHTNRRISENLFLTVRTVEFHLSSVYRKLGISGRRELVSALSTLEG
ncbi:LuxR C-terminal-related transcriptional regulator [Amycolatopsis sp. NPDC049868]|uniref:helix-turn-helix transcriptional regulator n=1 Tax=Amycolatopsis sp. NPDC049868 TaxID=3363934 RepID=UPI0037B42640